VFATDRYTVTKKVVNVFGAFSLRHIYNARLCKHRLMKELQIAIKGDAKEEYPAIKK
jgi:hypothetical protein